MNEQIQVMRLNEVLDLIRLSKTTLYYKCQSGEFPPSFKLGGDRSAGFFKHEVVATINAMATGANEKQLKALVCKLLEQRKERADKFLDQIAA